jgi:hypothetical protein
MSNAECRVMNELDTVPSVFILPSPSFIIQWFQVVGKGG